MKVKGQTIQVKVVTGLCYEQITCFYLSIQNKMLNYYNYMPTARNLAIGKFCQRPKSYNFQLRETFLVIFILQAIIFSWE